MKMTEHTTLTIAPPSTPKTRQLQSSTIALHLSLQLCRLWSHLLPRQRLIQSPYPIPSLWLSISIEINISSKVRFQDVVIKNRSHTWVITQELSEGKDCVESLKLFPAQGRFNTSHLQLKGATVHYKPREPICPSSRENIEQERRRKINSSSESVWEKRSSCQQSSWGAEQLNGTTLHAK